MSATFLITTEKMEEAIDRDGAWNVLIAMEIVLDDKATHMEVNWQDKKSAAHYRRLAKKVGALARELEATNV